VQFVGPENNKLLYDVLLRMREITGYGVILNTSFNIHGKAIVESPDDAIEDFLASGMDFLMMEGILVQRVPR
jgi:carbamoyltransferase